MVKDGQTFGKNMFLLLKYQNILIFFGEKKLHVLCGAFTYQGLNNHQEVCFTPVTKAEKLIVIFWDLFGAI